MRSFWFCILLACAAGLAACSPPKPPNISGPLQPVNGAQRANQKQTPTPIQEAPAVEVSVAAPKAPVMLRFHYRRNTYLFRPSANDAALLRHALNGAKTVSVMGRTDARHASAYDRHIAASRATDVARYIKQQGLFGGTLYINYLSGGDYDSDNTTATGRALNRRTEVFITYQ